MNKNAIIGIVVVLVVLAGGFMLYQNMQSNSATPEATPTDQQVTPEQTVSPEDTPSTISGEVTEGVKQVVITGSNFKFVPPTITVNKGDNVKIVFQNDQGFHDFTLPDFKVQTKQIGANQTDSVTFLADKSGSFEYFCSVGNHRAMGMKGTLIVK